MLAHPDLEIIFLPCQKRAKISVMAGNSRWIPKWEEHESNNDDYFFSLYRGNDVSSTDTEKASWKRMESLNKPQKGYEVITIGGLYGPFTKLIQSVRLVMSWT